MTLYCVKWDVKPYWLLVVNGIQCVEWYWLEWLQLFVCAAGTHRLLILTYHALQSVWKMTRCWFGSRLWHCWLVSCRCLSRAFVIFQSFLELTLVLDVNKGSLVNHLFTALFIWLSLSDELAKCCLCLHINQAGTNQNRCTQRLVILHTWTY